MIFKTGRFTVVPIMVTVDNMNGDPQILNRRENQGL